VSRAALSAPGRVIRAADIEFLHSHTVEAAEEAPTHLPSLRDAERSHIIRVLEAVDWNKLEAARVLDISRGTLYRKIDEYALEQPGRGRRIRREVPA
jgi:transcriptional regulator of acetoin/glycerol metabolism